MFQIKIIVEKNYIIMIVLVNYSVERIHRIQSYRPYQIKNKILKNQKV